MMMFKVGKCELFGDIITAERGLGSERSLYCVPDDGLT